MAESLNRSQDEARGWLMALDTRMFKALAHPATIEKAQDGALWIFISNALMRMSREGLATVLSAVKETLEAIER